MQAEQTLPEARHKIDYYQSLINTISQEADPLFRQFPQGYNTPDALTYMASMLEQKRATTYSEAAAMYDEYAHRRRLENLQESQLNEQRKQTNKHTDRTSCCSSHSNSSNDKGIQRHQERDA